MDGGASEEGRGCGDVAALAIGSRTKPTSTGDFFSALAKGVRSWPIPELVVQGHGLAPVAHRARRVTTRGDFEFLRCLLILEGVQQCDAAFERWLRVGGTGGRKVHHYQAGRPARPATWRIQLAIIMRPPVTDRRHATRADDHHGRPQRRYSRRVGKCLPTAERYSFVPEIWLDGGRNWWAHFAFTRINIAPPFLRKKIEDLRKAGASMSLSVAYVPIGNQTSLTGSGSSRRIGQFLRAL